MPEGFEQINFVGFDRYKFQLVHLPVSAWNRLKVELLRWHETFEVSPLPSLAQ